MPSSSQKSCLPLGSDAQGKLGRERGGGLGAGGEAGHLRLGQTRGRRNRLGQTRRCRPRCYPCRRKSHEEICAPAHRESGRRTCEPTYVRTSATDRSSLPTPKGGNERTSLAGLYRWKRPFARYHRPSAARYRSVLAQLPAPGSTVRSSIWLRRLRAWPMSLQLSRSVDV